MMNRLRLLVVAAKSAFEAMGHEWVVEKALFIAFKHNDRWSTVAGYLQPQSDSD